MWEGVGGNVGQSSCVGFCTDAAGWLEPGRSLSRRSQRFGTSFGRFPLPWNNAGCSVCDLNNVVPAAFETVETSQSVMSVGLGLTGLTARNAGVRLSISLLSRLSQSQVYLILSLSVSAASVNLCPSVSLSSQSLPLCLYLCLVSICALSLIHISEPTRPP